MISSMRETLALEGFFASLAVSRRRERVEWPKNGVELGGRGGSIFFLDHACGLAPGKKDPLLFLENSSVNVLQCIVWARATSAIQY